MMRLTNSIRAIILHPFSSFNVNIKDFQFGFAKFNWIDSYYLDSSLYLNKWDCFSKCAIYYAVLI